MNEARPDMNTRRTHSFPSRRGNSGFTLLEVLLAFLVFALSFATILEILSGSIRNTMRAREYTEAALIAQSVMGQVGLDIPLEDGGRANGDAGNYDWELEIFAYEDPSEEQESMLLAELTGIELLKIELHVTTGEYSRERSYRFSTIKAMLANRNRP
jgi:general secretion pathway protein I